MRMLRTFPEEVGISRVSSFFSATKLVIISFSSLKFGAERAKEMTLMQTIWTGFLLHIVSLQHKDFCLRSNANYQPFLKSYTISRREMPKNCAFFVVASQLFKFVRCLAETFDSVFSRRSTNIRKHENRSNKTGKHDGERRFMTKINDEKRKKRLLCRVVPHQTPGFCNFLRKRP